MRYRVRRFQSLLKISLIYSKRLDHNPIYNPSAESNIVARNITSAHISMARKKFFCVSFLPRKAKRIITIVPMMGIAMRNSVNIHDVTDTLS